MNFQNQKSVKVDVDGHTKHNSAPAIYDFLIISEEMINFLS